jgi:ferredoxin
VYRIEIDRSLCSGYGLCIDLAPDLLELDEEGVATARIGMTDDERAVAAADACPMAAIFLERLEAA